MRIYLPGPTGPDQLADKWQLEQRGYRVSTATCLMMRDLSSQGIEPTPMEFARMQIHEMLHADVVVVNDSHTSAQIHQLVQVCRFAGVQLVAQEELPAQAPHPYRRDEIIDAIDITHVEAPVSLRAELVEALAPIRQRMELASAWFERTCGWFFTNGIKQHRQPTPRPYATNVVKPSVTH